METFWKIMQLCFDGFGILLIGYVVNRYKNQRRLKENRCFYFEELHHISLSTKDLKLAMDFYGTFMKLPEIARPGRNVFPFNGAWYGLPFGKQLHIVENPNATFRHRRLFDDGEPPDIHFALRVRDTKYFSDLHNEAVMNGYPCRFGNFSGLEQLYVLDPDNNMIEISNLSVEQLRVTYV